MPSTTESDAVSTTIEPKLLPVPEETNDDGSSWEEIRPTVEAAGLGLLAVTGTVRYRKNLPK